ncbi:hypothetical protein D915_000887 [Fasciola hepatica]|uniref:Uncharacterized protein n=1 Tax=Fasciola hepatica TaxID=6192 RepID=A0A4E0RZP3_FASHE|nr:hypothetical protein D915_000887 [Fasciola hepatica]
MRFCVLVQAIFHNVFELETTITSGEKHTDLAYSILAGDPFDVVADSKVLEKEVTASTIIQLRQLLDSTKVALDYRRELHARRQLFGEDVRAYVQALRRLPEGGIADQPAGDHDKLILEQLLERASSTSADKEFYLRPSQNSNLAVDQADLLEKTGVPISRQKEHQSYTKPHSLHVEPLVRQYTQDRERSKWSGRGNSQNPQKKETHDTVDLTAALLKTQSDAIPLQRNIDRKAKTNLAVSKPPFVPTDRADILELIKNNAPELKAE